MEKKIIFESTLMKITKKKGLSAHTPCLCFTGVGGNINSTQGMGAINIQHDEFTKMNNRLGDKFFITDKTRSWGNNLNFEAIREFLGFSPLQECFTLGNSMGGFLAVIATRYFNVLSCVGFVPQFSVHPNVVPEETRWQDFISNIKNWKYMSLESYFVERTEYFMFHAGHGPDVHQWKRFPMQSNVKNIILKGAGHDAAAALKKAEVLYDCIDKAFSLQDPSKIVEKHFELVDQKNSVV